MIPQDSQAFVHRSSINPKLSTCLILLIVKILSILSILWPVLSRTRVTGCTAFNPIRQLNRLQNGFYEPPRLSHRLLHGAGKDESFRAKIHFNKVPGTKPSCQYFLCQGILQLVLNGSFQRPCPVDRIESGFA